MVESSNGKFNEDNQINLYRDIECGLDDFDDKRRKKIRRKDRSTTKTSNYAQRSHS